MPKLKKHDPSDFKLQYLVSRDKLEQKWAETNIQALYKECIERRLLDNAYAFALGNLNLEFGLPWDYQCSSNIWPRALPKFRHKSRRISMAGNDFMCM